MLCSTKIEKENSLFLNFVKAAGGGSRVKILDFSYLDIF